MSGAKKRGANVLSGEEPRAIFTHIYGHALNFALSGCETVQGYEEYQFEVAAEVPKLLGELIVSRYVAESITTDCMTYVSAT